MSAKRSLQQHNLMWIYEQTTGSLTRNGVLVGVGYSGRGPGLNNPELQAVPFVGPIPCGFYTIGSAFTSPVTGPLSMRLTPDSSNQMFDRDNFLTHGDTEAHNHGASEGCLIFNFGIRQQIAMTSLDRRLQVVTGGPQTPAVS